MEQLQNGYTLDLSPGAFPLSTDSMVLSGFIRLRGAADVLDLGSGCGTLGLLLCAKYPDCRVTGIELDGAAHRMALENSARNGLSTRLLSICADWNDIPSFLAPEGFSCCISNPPYFSGDGSESLRLPRARQEDQNALKGLFTAAAWALKFGGDFYLVHRPERLAELFVRAAEHRLEAKRLCLVRHRADGPVTLVLVRFRKGARPGLKWEELCLFDAQGRPTDAYKTLYHL